MPKISTELSKFESYNYDFDLYLSVTLSFMGHNKKNRNKFFSTFIFDNLFIQLSNFIQLSKLPIFMEILGNYDTKTNQWVLTPKQLKLVD